ncbi:MAG TPA: hypothetical protein VIM60_07150 [Edaphobacter sp.]
MKRIYSTFVATLSLLILFISAAACVALPASQATATAMDGMQMSHMAGAPEHDCCPSHAPAQHSTVSCCIVHHQPASTATDDTGNSSLAATHASLPTVLLNTATIGPPTSKKTGPPLRRPAHNLRI